MTGKQNKHVFQEEDIGWDYGVLAEDVTLYEQPGGKGQIIRMSEGTPIRMYYGSVRSKAGEIGMLRRNVNGETWVFVERKPDPDKGQYWFAYPLDAQRPSDEEHSSDTSHKLRLGWIAPAGKVLVNTEIQEPKGLFLHEPFLPGIDEIVEDARTRFYENGDMGPKDRGNSGMSLALALAGVGGILWLARSR